MRRLLLIFVTLSTINVFAQSKHLWLKYADDAFTKKDYATAIDYYKKIAS